MREGSNLDNALKQFRSLLDLKVNEIRTTGRLFNPQLLLHAYKIYTDCYDDLGNWDDPRKLLLWQQVIGYIQRSLPANDIQAFCDGLLNTEKKLRAGEPQGRLLKFQENFRRIFTSFYPLSASHLGFNTALLEDCLSGASGVTKETAKSYFLCFNAYINQKQQACDAYLQYSRIHNKVCCSTW